LAAWLTHYFAIPILAPHGVVALWLVWKGEPPARRNALQALLTLGLAFLPFLSWLPVMAYQATMPWRHLAPGNVPSVASCLVEVAGLGQGYWLILPAAAFLCLVAVGVAGSRDRTLQAAEGDARPPFPRWAGAVLAAGGVLAAAALWVLVP